MTRDETLEHQILGLSGRALCIALFIKYAALTVYGIGAAIVELPTFVLVTSSQFAVGWAITLAAFAALAAFAVGRTWTTGRFRLEKWATVAFILTFVAYSFALGFRAFTTANYDSLPLALIPVVVCVLPAIRWLSLVVHGHDVRYTKTLEGEP